MTAFIYRTIGALLVTAVLLLQGCGSAELEPDPCPNGGVEGCRCLTNNTCNPLDDGTNLVCVADTCQRPMCEESYEVGCVCGGERVCADSLVCINGNCEVDTGQSTEPPAVARCYTPCQGGVVDMNDGTALACSNDGLLEGCIDGAECLEGTCVPLRDQPTPGSSGPCVVTGDCETGEFCLDGGCVKTCTADGDCDGELECRNNVCVEAAAGQVAEVASCEGDSDCPIYQACIGNQCYSDCVGNDDCRVGRECYMRVCRSPCSNAANAEIKCGPGTVCETTDGTTGYCMPLGSNSGSGDAPDAPAPQSTSAGHFDIAPSAFRFAASDESGTVTITNQTFKERTFTIKKVSHTEFLPDTRRIVRESPLHWVEMAEGNGAPQAVFSLNVVVPAQGGTTTVTFSNLTNPELKRWEADLEVSEPELGTQDLSISYSSKVDGQWTGHVVYLANFGEQGLDAWIADKSNHSRLGAVGNAFIRRWGAMRAGLLSLDEFRAVLTATESGSWQWPSVQARCPSEESPNPNAACYLYDNNDGISVYSDYYPDNPVPTGKTEFPVTLNLRAPDQNAPGRWAGRIVSSESLQYAGDPGVGLTFQDDPSTCSNSRCINLLTSFDSTILVGGRYLTDAFDTSCSRIADGSYAHKSVPWLVPGFVDATSEDSQGRRYRYECRDRMLPYQSTHPRAALNSGFAASNPIPDGSTRRRHIELIDGALIEQGTIFLIFRERFESFLDPNDSDGFTAYGYMELQHAPTVLSDVDYVGSNVSDSRLAVGVDAPGCTDDVLAPLGEAMGLPGDVTLGSATASAIAIAIVNGKAQSGPVETILPGDAEKVHYLCVDTGKFDGGVNDHGQAGAELLSCPVESEVKFFTVQGAGATQAAIAALSCQNETCDGMNDNCGCNATYASWITNGTHSIRTNLAYTCSNEDEVLCDGNRTDLRDGKDFYPESEAAALYPKLDIEVANAFRYKTKFRNRSGSSVGFAPQVCVPNSNQIPYCYDPTAIEKIRERVDCAAHIYTDYYSSLNEEARGVLRDYLVRDFSYETVPTPDGFVTNDGFERLLSELLIMQGDEAFTTAFASRFDLAGQNLATFEGDKFEVNGIELSGGAGFEMYTLYQAAQYYQYTLDRFYRLSPLLWRSISELPAGQGFVTPATVSSYFNRLIRASSQKTRVWSEVAKRYQSFNRPELARVVVERAYTAAHLESIVLGRMMLRLMDLPNSTAAAQIVHSVEQAAITYTVALLAMREVYDDITDNVTFFGIQPDFIPFPVLRATDSNAFTHLLDRAQQKLARAHDKEVRALEDNRAFETSSAVFQSQLAGITRDYDSQLSDVCGSFEVVTGDDTAVYPAVPKYAYLDDRAKLFGDPCGLMGNGTLHEAAGQLELMVLSFEQIKLSERNLLAEISDADARAKQQCDRISSLKDFRLQKEDEIIDLNTAINSMQTVISTVKRGVGFAAQLTEYIKCSAGLSTDCPTAIAASALYTTVAGLAEVAITAQEITIAVKQTELAEAQKEIVLRDIEDQCTSITIDTEFTVKSLRRKMLELELEALKLQYNVRLALSGLQKQRNRATALMAQQAETQEMAINVEAARNDPNVRIYRNDAVLAADRTFYAALIEAYKVTQLYEYYTSQCYAARDQLQLVRMVSHGDFTLEFYLAELDDAFVEFQQLYGEPDLRLAIVSMRDAILDVPDLTEDSVGATSSDRRTKFVEALQDPTRLDSRGYVTIDFGTTIDELSPLTRNHKIAYIEAEIQGSDTGDRLGRVYLTQKGTGVVRGVEGEKNFYALPQRTAVINTFFNNAFPLDRELYKNERLRDRPFVNTGWQLVFNLKDESVNQDIKIPSLTDIRLYIYYTDFTEL